MATFSMVICKKVWEISFNWSMVSSGDFQVFVWPKHGRCWFGQIALLVVVIVVWKRRDMSYNMLGACCTYLFIKMSLTQGIENFPCLLQIRYSRQLSAIFRRRSFWSPVAKVFSALLGILTDTISVWWGIKTIFWQDLAQYIGKWIIGTFGYMEYTSEEIVL